MSKLDEIQLRVALLSVDGAKAAMWRTDEVESLVAALRAVEALHHSVAPTPSQPWVTCDGCTNGAMYPCPTIQAIQEALEQHTNKESK